jgi:GTP-binding protein
MRSSTADELVRLDRARIPGLDEALEFVREDEAVEVTPGAVRLRKVNLSSHERLRAMRASRRERVPVG